MVTSVFSRSIAVTLVLALACTVVGMPKAHATSDWVKVVAGIAAGALVYEALDDDGPSYRSRAPVYRRYDPPRRYSYRGPTPREAYDEGYRDGFKDGADYGYEEGWHDGRRVGFRQGERAGYREGYQDGRQDARRRGRRGSPPAWHPPGRQGGGYWYY